VTLSRKHKELKVKAECGQTSPVEKEKTL